MVLHCTPYGTFIFSQDSFSAQHFSCTVEFKPAVNCISSTNSTFTRRNRPRTHDPALAEDRRSAIRLPRRRSIDQQQNTELARIIHDL
jgi:hypothetical protein